MENIQHAKNAECHLGGESLKRVIKSGYEGMKIEQ